MKIFDTYKEVLDEALILKQKDESPQSNKSKKLAEKWWNMILEFTGGDMSLIPKLEAFNNSKENWNNDLSKKQQEVDDYLGKALNYYLQN